MAYQGKAVVEANQILGRSKEQKSVTFQSMEEITNEFLLEFWVKIYQDVAAEDNVNRGLKGKPALRKIQPSEQQVVL